MKQLLIILISILLLSSPVIGNNQKGETLYLWGKYPDYKWMGFGDKETQPIYQGDVKNGKPDGLGFLIYPNGDKYVGSWVNGKRNEGTVTHSDGSTFVGNFKDGKYWIGIMTLPKEVGIKIVGEWRNSMMWNGKQITPNGKITGKYVNGKYIEQLPPYKTNQ